MIYMYMISMILNIYFLSNIPGQAPFLRIQSINSKPNLMSFSSYFNFFFNRRYNPLGTNVLIDMPKMPPLNWSFFVI